jgi:hypothetical protein
MTYSHQADSVLIFVKISLIEHRVMVVPRILFKNWIVAHSASMYAYQDEIHGHRWYFVYSSASMRRLKIISALVVLKRTLSTLKFTYFAQQWWLP